MFRKIASLLMVFLFSVILIASVNGSRFYITGMVKVEQGLVEGTLIQIYRNGGLLQNVSVNRTGNFRVPVELNHLYRFEFMKDGFYSKAIEIDTKVPPDVCRDDCTFPPYQIAVMLYKKVPGVTNIKNEPARISYNPQVDNFDAELIREQRNLSDELLGIMQVIKAKSKSYEQESKALIDQKYRDYLQKAEQNRRNGNYDEARKLFREALLIKPEELYPREKVNEMYELLVKEQITNALGPAVEADFTRYLNYADAQMKAREYTFAKVALEIAKQIRPNEKRIDDKLKEAKQHVMEMRELALQELRHDKVVYERRTQVYNNYVAEGDKLFLEEKLAEARDQYARAVTQIDENSYALLMAKKIDELNDDSELAQQLAKEREAAERKRLMEARNKAYEDALREADRLLEERIYRDAIEYYELALSIKSFEFYPKDQIRRIHEILGDLQLRGEEYNATIREADQLFKTKDYLRAKDKYSQAHKIIPDEKYALSRIEEIDRLLERTEQLSSKREEYDAFVLQGDELFKQKKYNEAIERYQQSLFLFENEAYPKEQIVKIRGILSRELNEASKQEKLLRDYENTVSLADQAFNRASYQSARTLYGEALQLIPGQEYPRSQIRKIDNILEEERQKHLAGSALENIDFSNLENVSEERRRAAYEEAMKLGNSFLTNKEFGIARFYFRRALALIPNDAKADEKLNEVEKIILGENANESKFQEMMKKGQEAFNNGDFGVARFYYGKAKDLKPNDSEVNERLLVVSTLADNTEKRMANREFDAAMTKANTALSANNYSVARFFLRKALSLKPNDPTAKTRLQEVEDLINGQ